MDLTIKRKKTNIYSYEFGNGSLRLYTVIESIKTTQEIDTIYYEIALMQNRSTLNSFRYNKLDVALKEFDYKRRVFEKVKKDDFVSDLENYRFLLGEREYYSNKSVYDVTRFKKDFDIFKTFKKVEDLKKSLEK